jgi:hypothetical protein
VPGLAVSAIDVLLVVGLGAAGFLVVVLVCAGVLAMLHLILPSTDAGAAAVDHVNRAEAIDPDGDPARLDTEVDA